MTTARPVRFALYGLAVLTIVGSAPDAHALIVVDGQIVPGWPEARAPMSIAAFRDGQGSFYDNPTGEVWGLTLLVDFSDQQPAFSIEEIRAWLDDLNYTEDNHNGGVRDYYRDVSNGVIDLRNEVFGFYRAQHPKSYYEGLPGYSGAEELVGEMIQHFDAEVDFSRYDNDGDGRTEAVSVLYAGPSETFGQGLWPHSGSTNNNVDGVRVSRYTMTQLGNQLDNYVFVHETGHMVFGWPDLYGFGDYCVMGNRISTINPVGINDFFRADQGWIPSVEVDMDTPALYIARPNGAAYYYRNPDEPDELFLWSNLQDTGRFQPLDGGGILLFHFDHRIRNNNPPNPLALAIVQADGKEELNTTTWPMPGHDPDDYFRAGHNDEFSDSTNPPASWNDGSDSGLRIHAISENGSQMTFAVGEGEAPTTPEQEPEPIGGGNGGASSGGTGGASGGSGGFLANGGAAGEAPNEVGGNAGQGSVGGYGGVAGQSGSAGEGGHAGTAGTADGGTAAVDDPPGGNGGQSNPETPPEPSVTAAPLSSTPSAPTAQPSATATALPSASAPLVSDSDSNSDAGCACRTSAKGSGQMHALLALSLAGIAALRRRRDLPRHSR